MIIFLLLFIVLLSARLFTKLAVRLKTPPVIGELLAEIGIIMLLFEVGLETDIKRLVETGLKSIIVASMGLSLPFVFWPIRFGSSIYRWDVDSNQHRYKIESCNGSSTPQLHRRANRPRRGGAGRYSRCGFAGIIV